MLIKDTENAVTAQTAWFAVQDINRRAAHAYNSNRDFFDSADHQTRVSLVEQIMRDYFADWQAIYTTARAATRNRPAHTEVKFNRVMLDRKKTRAQFLAALEAVGVSADCVVCKPATQSYSVHIS